MKILHIIYTNGIGGAEKHLKYLLPGLKMEGIDCELLILCPNNSINLLNILANEIKHEGVKSTVISIKSNISLTTLEIVKKFLIDNHFSVVHSHLLRTDLIISLVKQFYIKNLFIISTKHGYQEKVLIKYNPNRPNIKRNIVYYITKYTFSKIDKNISVSKYISQLFINLKLTKQFFPVIYHGVNIEINLPDNQSIFKESFKQLIIVGRLEESKGHIYAFKAFKIITEKHPNSKLILLGEGSIKESLKKAAEELGLTDKILFLGFQKYPFSFISQSNIIIIPSLYESFGLVFIEAMALGKTIVAFDAPAGNEILQNNVTAILSQKGDMNLLAKNILALLEDKDKSNRISINALNKYKESFTVQIMITNTANFYKKVLNTL